MRSRFVQGMDFYFQRSVIHFFPKLFHHVSDGISKFKNAKVQDIFSLFFPHFKEELKYVINVTVSSVQLLGLSVWIFQSQGRNGRGIH